MYQDSQRTIDRAVSCLKEGGVLLYLSDTIWGLGCDAENEQAVKRVFSIKNRSLDKPLISLVTEISMLKRYAPEIHPRVETMLHYHKRPITVVHPNVQHICYPAKSKNNDAAIRIIQTEPVASIIRKFSRAITSSSANRSGNSFPSKYEDIDPSILEAVDYIVHSADYEEERVPSSVISYDKKGDLIVLRE